MRTFIALEMQKEIKDQLARIQSNLKAAGADVKWVETQNIHLTLKFLGEVSEDRIKEVKSTLDEIAKQTKPFEISVKDVGAFPKASFPRVIWAGIDNGKAESEQLANLLEDNLENMGFERESRPFRTHLTIGRVKSPKNKEALIEKLLSTKIEKPLIQKVNSVVLFKSDLRPTGPIYSKLHEATFS